jgi:hypothetical protein
MTSAEMIADQQRAFAAARGRDPVWGYTIVWGLRKVSAVGFPTRGEMEAARAEEFNRIREMGWTPPRWWQFWRGGDTRP